MKIEQVILQIQIKRRNIVIITGMKIIANRVLYNMVKAAFSGCTFN
jgi:hypothetical protein